MNTYNKPIKTVTLAYFSGTGCTQAVVDCFENQLIKRKLQVKKLNIAVDDSYIAATTDLLIILSPVYAFRLASIIENWTRNLPEAKGTYAAIISVSGGGEISPNTACRMKCKHFLKRKKYNLIYEKMLVMPSNFAIQAKQQLNLDLINILPQKVNKIIGDIMSGKKNILHPKLRDRIFAFWGNAEHFGAGLFALSIHASNTCNQCGLCVKNCPKKNIRMKNGRPKFGSHCLWCMKCIYSCPRKALRTRIFKFAVLKKGFNIKQMAKEASQKSCNQKHGYSNDILWQGVINYLKEEE
ncbi:MAG TPA: EFR1 family ferrodoxin [Oscillospiraceae bacterium]|nr:EFR1 family ferrodoxin [Oscillospiraceae bacterium]